MLARTIDTMNAEAATPVSVSIARSAIASAILGEESTKLRIGDITLHSHQRSAVSRIQRVITEYGGALLCDDVGLGKTYVALALAATYESVTIVAPATLASMWGHALEATRVKAEFISLESLGRSGAPKRRRTLIIVDEAHHFRNPCTRRYSALAQMCMITPVVLLTATPVHNSRDDISAIAALFVGSRAYTMTDAELAPMIVRRDTGGGLTLNHVPVVEHAAPHIIGSSEAVMDMIVALPPPVPPRDGSIATRLVVHGLVRQWVSSNAALTGALKRRIARSHGLVASLEAGRYPTAAELSAWVYTGDAVQLAFAELLLPAAAPLSELTSALRMHVAALTELLSLVRNLDDRPLADFVRQTRARHPNEKIVAFSCYAETAEALYRALRPDGHIALLTARGAMIASGPISRAELLGQFAPQSTATRDITEHEDVRLLVATDLLSEGVNLQGASVVIHLDLPWTAARIEQRIGRLARLGSPHPRVMSYSVNPPPRAESFLHELEIITRKSEASTQIFGAPTTGNLSGQAPNRAAVSHHETTGRIIEGWRSDDERTDDGDLKPLVAHATLPRRGALGAWLVDGTPMLLAWDETTSITTDPASIETAAKLADDISDDDCGPADFIVISSALRAAADWYEQRRAWHAVTGSGTLPIAQRSHDVRRSLARVADATSTNAGFARRSESAAIATRLRNAATGPLPLAVEWSLESLSECADDAAVNTILDLVDRARPTTDRVRDRGIRCIALIVFAPRTSSPE